ncbi:MAG: hypothetical protein FJ149_06840 [Euryarchaeota archaeon]|nr:hypothetical protein [Euryarchaeota archaeon]
MAIRDGLTIDLDNARTEPVVRKGKLRYVAQPPQPAPKRAFKALAGLLVAVLILAGLYYAYTQRDVPDRLRLDLEKTTFQPGEEVGVTVFLVNDGPRKHSYTFTSSQLFGLEVRNATGDIVAEYSENATAATKQVTLGPYSKERLGVFLWNQTTLVIDGENETWVQVQPGNYTIRAYFKGSADIAAERRITIGF